MWLGMVDTAMNPTATPDQRLAVDMHVATSAMSDLTPFVRGARPERPDLLPLSDQSLLEMLRKAKENSVRLTDGDREVVRAFAEWRYAVLRQETEDTQRVEVLLETARTLERTCNEYPAHKYDLQRIQGFLASTWDVKIPPIPSRWEAPAVARRAAQDLDTLPSWLRDPERWGWCSGTTTGRAALPAPQQDTGQRRLPWYDDSDD